MTFRKLPNTRGNRSLRNSVHPGGPKVRPIKGGGDESKGPTKTRGNQIQIEKAWVDGPHSMGLGDVLDGIRKQEHPWQRGPARHRPQGREGHGTKSYTSRSRRKRQLHTLSILCIII